VKDEHIGTKAGSVSLRQSDVDIMWSTGLVDNSASLREIYEKDIIQDEDSKKYLVSWKSGGYICLGYDGKEYSLRDLISKKKVVVIGNTYEGNIIKNKSKSKSKIKNKERHNTGQPER